MSGACASVCASVCARASATDLNQALARPCAIVHDGEEDSPPVGPAVGLSLLSLFSRAFKRRTDFTGGLLSFRDGLPF